MSRCRLFHHWDRWRPVRLSFTDRMPNTLAEIRRCSRCGKERLRRAR